MDPTPGTNKVTKNLKLDRYGTSRNLTTFILIKECSNKMTPNDLELYL